MAATRVEPGAPLGPYDGDGLAAVYHLIGIALLKEGYGDFPAGQSLDNLGVLGINLQPCSKRVVKYSCPPSIPLESIICAAKG